MIQLLDYVFLLLMYAWGCDCASTTENKYVKDPAFSDQMCAAELVVFQAVTSSAIACALKCGGTLGCANFVYLRGNKTCFGVATDNPFDAGSSPLPGASFYTAGAASVARPTACPDRWVSFEGNCYLFPDRAVTFQEAQDFCEQENGHLVEVYSAADNTFLRDEMRKLNRFAGWIGATDLTTEGSWTWLSSNEAVNFADWTSPSETFTAAEDCAIFWQNADYRWADILCTFPVMPICKQSGAAGVCIWETVG